jgi:nuclear control of ATPase protein 2
MKIMGSGISRPLQLTLLLALYPLSTEAFNFLFFKRKSLASSAASANGAAAVEQTLAQASIDSFNTGGADPIFTKIVDGTGVDISELPFWSWFTLPKMITDTIPTFLKKIILFKPPVGIVTMYVFFNLALSKNRRLIAKLLSDEDEASSRSTSKRRKNKVAKRSLDLDEADGKLMIGLGGVEAVRTELCIAALEEYILKDEQDTKVFSSEQEFSELTDLSNPYVLSYYATATRDVLQIHAPSKSSKEYFIERTLYPLSRLEGLFTIMNENDTSSGSKTSKVLKKDDTSILKHDLIAMSAKVAEIRTLDSLLRVLRDRLLTSAVRLSRKEKHRVWRLQWYENGFGRMYKQWFRKIFKSRTLEDDRRNLQLTSAALKREMERLGQVQTLLLSRPFELSETCLLTASTATVDDMETNNEIHRGGAQKLKQKVLNGYTSAGQIDPAGAKLALGSWNRSGQECVENGVQEWTTEAHEWTRKARGLVCDLVSETMSVVYDSDERIEKERTTNVGQDLSLLAQWSLYKKSDYNSWETVLALVENLTKARLLRENKYLPNAIDLKRLFKRYDVFGIPSSCVTIAFSLVVHNMVKPYWSDIVKFNRAIFDAIWGVIEFRFYIPAKDIVLDLLNRRPSLVDQFTLINEEASLDNMLRDLGLSDGSKAARQEALAAASRMYEEELKQGAIKNLFRGGMVRLLLIQVQQLKTGMLQAMGSIDHLMDANRLNVQLLTAIPAFLLVTFGTKFFFQALYSLRSRDLVGMSSAKAELSDILRKMERCLLLASHNEDTIGLSYDSKGVEAISSDSTVVLQPHELGEFILHMHSYLVILDYCSPPFAAKACDSIQSGFQDLLMQGQITTKRQIALLSLITAKHNELMKSI